MLCVLPFYTGILCTPEYKISWEEASRQCKTKYESELITYQCIGDLNLTAEIIKELGINVEAWIDGKVSDLGCTRGENIKKELTLCWCEIISLPFITNPSNHFFRCLLPYKTGTHTGGD